MPTCPKCGRDLPKKARLCPDCAKRFDAVLKQGEPGNAEGKPTTSGYLRPRGLGAKKYFLAPVILLPMAILSILALTTFMQNEIQPYGFLSLSVEGGPGSDAYKASFALGDQNLTNGASNGYMILKIIDGRGNSLYSSEFMIRAGEFRQIRGQSGDVLMGYAWEIPMPNVSKGVPDAQGYGKAIFTFVSLRGRSITRTLDVKIPQ